MGTVYYDDHTGSFVTGKVWELLSADDFDYVHGETPSDKVDEIRDCPLDKRHVTGLVWQHICLSLFGDQLGDFVPIWDMGFLIVSERFAERLKGSPLTGYRLRPVVKVGDNQSSVHNPKLHFLEATGKGGLCGRLKVQGSPNLCPFCGKEPLICPACKVLQRECLSCGKKTIVGPKEPLTEDDRRLRFTGYPDRLIVEAKDWDGSDCFQVKGDGGNLFFISNRAKLWLEGTHTYPIKITPALLNTA